MKLRYRIEIESNRGGFWADGIAHATSGYAMGGHDSLAIIVIPDEDEGLLSALLGEDDNVLAYIDLARQELPALETYAGPSVTKAIIYGPGGDTLALFFSYGTCVAFTLNGARVVRENKWGATTGRHLNAIDGGSAAAKSRRVRPDQFAANLRAAMRELGRTDQTGVAP